MTDDGKIRYDIYHGVLLAIQIHSGDRDQLVYAISWFLRGYELMGKISKEESEAIIYKALYDKRMIIDLFYEAKKEIGTVIEKKKESDDDFLGRIGLNLC